MRFRRRHDRDPDRTTTTGATVALTVDTGTATATGRRADNQDRCVAAAGLAVVSDGMGGHRGGALAAELSVEAVVATLGAPAAGAGSHGADRLAEAFTHANAAVRAARAADPEVGDMGATLTVAVAVASAPGRSRWVVGHVGDSPAFVVTAEATTAITEDHNGAAELVAAGVLTREQAATHPGRHLLHRAVGPDPAIVADRTEVVLHEGDALVLTSDGVSGSVEPSALGTLVREAGSAGAAASRLVDVALANGATDNVTAVVVRQVPSSTA